jgi:hypothetical protein
MKQLWTLGLLLLLVIPIAPSSHVATRGNSIRAESQANVSSRVYGEDLSSVVYDDVSFSSYRSFVEKFTENGSRWIRDYTLATSGANMYARNYIIQQFDKLSGGRIETEIIGNYLNVVGKLPGYLPGDNPAFAVTAHYDSARGSPGANCDGSGIAAVLELIRVMSKYEWPLDIYFVAFNGLLGEVSMEGSPQVANAFFNRGIELLMLYNVDTILLGDDSLPEDERIQFGYAGGVYHHGRYWADLARQVSNNIGQNFILQVPSSSFFLWESSDHYTFYRQGFPVICAFESGIESDSAYQTSDDRHNYLGYRYTFGQETTAVIGSSIAFTMSRALGEPVKTHHEFTLGVGGWERIYITITTPTTVNISARWFGGRASFFLTDPSDALVTYQMFDHASAWEPSPVLSHYVSQNGQYTLWVNNNDSRTIGVEVNTSYEADIEANGVLDSQEYWIDPALFESDQDSDDLSDAEEIFLGTDLFSVDTDNDAMPDKYEVDNGFDPRNPSDGGEDADSDGLSNAQEYTGGLNPFSADSDSDSIPDLWEIEHGLDPLEDDANLDFDGDGYSNLEEYLNDTDPQRAEPLIIPTEFIIASIFLIAAIGVFVYTRRREAPWN